MQYLNARLIVCMLVGALTQGGSAAVSAFDSGVGKGAAAGRCALPGQVRKLGAYVTYQSPSQTITATSEECKIRGGQWTSLNYEGSRNHFPAEGG